MLELNIRPFYVRRELVGIIYRSRNGDFGIGEFGTSLILPFKGELKQLLCLRMKYWAFLPAKFNGRHKILA